ncbi:MAG: glycosyltransferase family 2 protein [Candidatus Lokiarchaeota archaeon]|nr:glycosyltransferase family 2 protein [Candidatus Lokiarchaeota archaeon]
MLVSVIIITLNEVENLEKTLNSTKNAALMSSGKKIPIEVIVSDGGSTDGTIKLAEAFADKVIHSQKGRYMQLNIGAKTSKGEILLFLHADTILLRGAILRILNKFQDPRVLGGAFKKQWSWSPKVTLSKFLNFSAKFWEGFGNWLTQLIKEFPGDNAFFIKREVFNELNGFSPMWICEDFDISRRLLKFSKKTEKNVFNKLRYRKKIAYIRSPIKTSTRRFEMYGFFRTVYFWFKIYWLWRAGFTQDQLRKLVPKYKITPQFNKRSFLRF